LLAPPRGIWLSARVRIGVYVGNAAGSRLDELLSGFRAAERYGLHTAWTGQVFQHDALLLLALAGRETRQIELGSWVLPIQRAHPAALAQQALTAQLACDGRLVLGVGISHASVVEKRMGLPYTAHERTMRAYLDALVPLLRGEAVALPGASTPIRVDVPGSRAPVLFLAALGPRMLALAAQRAEGVAIWFGAERFLGDVVIPRLREAAARAGRPTPRIACALPVAVTSDVEGARAVARQTVSPGAKLPAYRRVLEQGGIAEAEDIAIIGAAAAVADRIRAFAALGISDFHAVPIAFGGEAVRAATLEVLAELAAEHPAAARQS
jgi:F420-dependent oxidoreductase-like protein